MNRPTSRSLLSWLRAGLALLGLIAALGCIDTVPLPEVEHKSGDDDATTPAESGTGNDTDVGGGGSTGGAGDGTAPGTGLIQLDYLYYSAPPMLLVGRPNVVSEPGEIKVRALGSSAWTATRLTTADGSFNLTISADFEDTVEIGYFRQGQQIASATLTLELMSVVADQAQLDLRGAASSEVTSPADVTEPGIWVLTPQNGHVTVAGGPGTLSRGLVVVVANLEGGAAAVVLVEADGSFAASLEGQSGQTLSLFAVEPAKGNGGGERVSVVIP